MTCLGWLLLGIWLAHITGGSQPTQLVPKAKTYQDVEDELVREMNRKYYD